MSRQKNLKRNLLICLLAGSAVMYTLPLHAATSVVANNALPNFDKVMSGALEKNPVISNNGLTMDITQTSHNAVIKWNSFDVGGSATVNFWGPDKHNTLNYVNSANMSQIYGTINANNNGNIFIVNPAGVQIGPSAQINVGSLYVSNSRLSDDALKAVEANNKNFDFNAYMNNNGTHTDAALMSLGNINATNVTFEGDGRIVIDSERLINGNNSMGAANINIKTKADNTGNVIIGYEAYDEENKKYTVANDTKAVAIVNGTAFNQDDAYMWVEDVEQLQAIDTNLSGNYALRNSIDATATKNWNNNKGFSSIGVDATGKTNWTGFTGKFDGIDYNIFGLTINGNGKDYVGLFGVTNGATINNVTLVGGNVSGGSSVGAVVGYAKDTTISNVINSASVTGDAEVGGIVGTATGSTITNAVNTGTVHSNGESDGRGGTVSNAGGLIGYMFNGTLDGNSYNLGNVSGDGYNVGGLVGHAVNSAIGDGTNLVYNRLDVTGAYNVGGIVGNMEGSTVQNAENSGSVAATGHTTEDYTYHTAITDKNNIPNGGTLDNENDIAKVRVDVANVGGIAGTSAAKEGKASKITNVTNSGDVSSSKVAGEECYAAGNVGGVVGRAEDTDITNATNKENDVRGAHNVGGVAGYFGSSVGDNTNEDTPHYTITNGINDGGDIMATGARKNDKFVQELVRRMNDGSNETFTVGNIGGVVGYMDGDNVYVTGSANRGTVHTSEPADPADVKDWEKAANVGGIVGKIDRSDTKELDEIKNNTSLAAVNNSYNTGDVLGYTGVGGVVGMMYNGEVAGSYNLGYIGTTRQTPIDGTNIDSLNMGGVVGDTTENANAKGVVIYDVYNKGQIGDSEFNYYGRHVGGIVGRLSGTVEKAYNTGAIYNGYSVVGGIAGWVAEGSINNAFNTGNITVYNQNKGIESQVGGIAGAVKANGGITTISNAYNLGTIRSFKAKTNNSDKGINLVGGIVGDIRNSGEVIIKNVYTTGNIYAGIEDANGNIAEDTNNNIGSIYGKKNANTTVNYAYYIKPQKGLGFTDLHNSKDPDNDRDNSNKAIAFDDKDNIKNYEFEGGITRPDKTTGVVDENSAWRIYDGNTPILNAFLPKAEEYFDQYDDKDKLNGAGIGSIQYGTAYDPLLTIINAAKGTNELKYNWEDLGINNAAGIAVYGAGLTLDSFRATGATGYFGGTIYADGALNINGVKNDIGIGSAADIYGSAVNITTDGKVTIYGDVTATGNTANGATIDTSDVIDVKDKGNITITAGDVDVYGTLTSASNTQGANVTIPGIEDSAVTWTPGNIKDPYASMSDIADRFAHTTGASAVDGNINITANGTTDKDGNLVSGGNVNLYFGNQEQGLITTGGDLNVEATGDVYVDSDLDIDGNMTLASTGKDSEVLLTLTNIGKVQANRFAEIVEKALNGKDLKANRGDLIQAIVADVEAAYPGLKFGSVEAGYIVDALKNYAGDENNRVQAFEKLNNEIAVEYMHDFMHSFDNNTSNKINLNAASGNAKLTVDMWDYDNHKFDFKKYDTKFYGTETGHNFVNELNNLNVYINNKKTDPSKTVYIEVSNGDQLKGIQEAAKGNSDILGYNFALKGDINASHVEYYKAIGTGSDTGFTGTFDGRGNRIIGLNVTGDNAGIFSTVGTDGVVKDVNIYSGNFTGTDTAGAVAGVNSGRIEGVKTFGNTVEALGSINSTNIDGKYVGAAGGITGINSGTVDDVETTGSVIAGDAKDNNGALSTAGGIVGINNAGATISNSYSDSAATANANTTYALGGVVGINNGNVQYVDSLGVTNGGATNSSNIGGIIGINNGNMYSGYNESIVSGKNNVGGIIGENSTGGTVTNIVNATSVTGENVSADNVSQYVGGLVGSNSGSVTNGRNNGTITGTNYVGGMVGSNAQGATLTNLVNDSSAAIEGENYVGGIAGTNAGTITAQNQSNLINRGSITGQNYVGGVAGENIGTIEYVKNDVNLYVKDDTKTAQYFGGVAGINGRVDDETTTDVNEAVTGTITSATNEGDVVAENAQYVGGIVGWNTSQGKLVGMGNSNEGTVIGGSYVGGVIGKNDAAIGSKDSAQVGITNEGTVIATKGGAGGLIGENNAAITNTVMINRGEVHGNNTANDNSGTGGIIGVNMGDITYSSLINEVTGTVTGTNNVGGLIGVNKADITGGRYTVTGEDAGMYINKIYNNGVINVGTYGDTDNDGDYEFTAGTGSNIGGLIGDNKGSLTAGYNTGAINAADSENVGGIAGSNSGTIDQVFNTVMTPDNAVKPDGSKQEASITGGTNVGGLVGDNQANGEITNAYNTSNVVATNQYGIVGGLVGNNQENGEITNAYNTSTVTATGVSGNLVGTNSGTVQYVYGVADKLIGNGNAAEYGYVIDGSDTWLQEGTYEDFAFGANGWKIYDGSTLPMLSVFLTKVTVVDQHLVNQYFSAKHYGELHQITADDIKALIAIGAISAPDGFGAFNNNNGLIQGVADDAMANSGNWLYSQQILGSNINGLFNPNNLGYDISLVYSPFENEDWPHNRWDYLFNDAPFDRNKDFRERKAEVNFVDGGMEI